MIFMRKREIERDDRGVFLMNYNNFKLICEQDGLYEYPELNSKIYLHHKGIERIENMHLLPALRCLYFENNLIKAIEGLEHCPGLLCLFLHNNRIEHVGDLSYLLNLRVLNLSGNQLHSLRGVSSLPALESLSATDNYLSTADSLSDLPKCGQLTNLDLSNNRLEEQVLALTLPEDRDSHVPNILSSYQQILRSTNVKCLRLVGNPIVRQIRNYRTFIHGLVASLTYFDDRPVSEDDKRVGRAYIAGGREAEKAMREQIKQERVAVKEEAKAERLKTMDGYRLKKVSAFSYFLEEAETRMGSLHCDSLRRPEDRAVLQQQIEAEQERARFYRQVIETNRNRIGREISTQNSEGGQSQEQQGELSARMLSSQGSDASEGLPEQRRRGTASEEERSQKSRSQSEEGNRSAGESSLMQLD